MQTRSEPTPQAASATPSDNDRSLLLEEVDFKWLMAGQGWWVDTTRLHCDQSYARHLFDMVETQPSVALRDCAALLRAQAGVGH